jgi:hypothetical protein
MVVYHIDLLGIFQEIYLIIAIHKNISTYMILFDNFTFYKNYYITTGAMGDENL